MVLQKKSDGCESRLIQETVKVFAGNRNRGVLSFAVHSVGIDSRVNIMAIYGMWGIGKPTLVKIGYNLNFDKFDGINFLAIVNKTLEKHNCLVRLQNEIEEMLDHLRWIKSGESQLLEVIDGNTSLSYNSKLNGSDLSEYMDCLGENLNDVLERLRE
ncbi:hypothetical protein BC332_14870 [Capsicum chinense]|nr:hypothetical protein BC332_14870 [Capsicum chinense]